MRSAMLAHGFDVYPVSDGKIHRFKGPEDKKLNGWYVFNSTYGAFGNWKSGINVKWSERRQLSGHEWRELERKIAAERKARREQRMKRHKAAAIEALRIWQRASQVASHPYLEKKNIHAHGIRQLDDALVIPMYRNREVKSVQRIFHSGEKRFLKGGDTHATYYPIGNLNGQLWIAEGFATAASVFEASGTATACAFSGLNMVKVAKAFHKRYPNLDIRIAGDAGGEKYANEAMIVCLGKGAIPVFDEGDEGSDWNDFFSLYGKEMTRENLNAGI